MSQELPARVRAGVDALVQREFATPALLYLAAHRPLAFVAGQLLYLAAPTLSLLGVDDCAVWASLLSEPDGPPRLERALNDAARTRRG